MKHYFAVDVETTGQYMNKNAMIAFGCTVMDQDMKEVDNFVTFMSIPNERIWEERCVNEFWSKQKETLEHIEKHMKEPKEEMERFSKCIDEIDLRYGSNLVVLSDFCAYDIAWINNYLEFFTNRYSLYYMLAPNEHQKGKEKIYWFRRIWDTNSAYHGALTILHPNEHHEWNLEKKLGIQNERWENDPNPLNDARNIASNFILFLKKNKKMNE
eukprot:gene2321-2789_t